MITGINNSLFINNRDNNSVQKAATAKVSKPVFEIEKEVKKVMQVYNDNTKVIEQIKQYYSPPGFSKNSDIILGKKVLGEFQNKYGEVFSPSMEQLKYGPGFKYMVYGTTELVDLRHKITNTPYENQLDELEKEVKKNKIANCGELSYLVQKELLSKGVKSAVINFKGKIHQSKRYNEFQNNHCAVIIGGDSEFYKHISLDCPDELLKGKVVIDPWIGGVFEADKWKKMVEHLYNEPSENITVSPKYSSILNDCIQDSNF